MSQSNRFTPKAERRWQELGGRSQTLYLNNVWCGRCRKSTTIVRFKGRMDRDDLVLKGECIECGSPVARVIEGH